MLFSHTSSPAAPELLLKEKPFIKPSSNPRLPLGGSCRRQPTERGFAGGAYSFAKNAFGHDYGFLTAWFLVLTYFTILWSNAADHNMYENKKGLKGARL